MSRKSDIIFFERRKRISLIFENRLQRLKGAEGAASQRLETSQLGWHLSKRQSYATSDRREITKLTRGQPKQGPQEQSQYMNQTDVIHSM